MVVSFSALTTHYSLSPNSPFDGAMIIRGRRGTMCEDMAAKHGASLVDQNNRR